MKSTHLIWQDPDWPNMHYDQARVAAEVVLARRAQGAVEGKLAALGFVQRQELAAEAWSQEAMSTAAIEGERLDLQAVRSSVARRLGVADVGYRRIHPHLESVRPHHNPCDAQPSVPAPHFRSYRNL